MKIIIIILSTFILLYKGGLKIQLSPFEISLPNWMLLVGAFFLVIGVGVIVTHFTSIEG